MVAASWASTVAVVKVLMSTVTVEAANGLPEMSKMDPGRKLKLSAMLLSDELFTKVII